MGRPLEIDPVCQVAVVEPGAFNREVKVAAAHPEIPIHIYPAGHGFSCDERGSYHEPSARTARTRTMEFFSTHVG